VPQLAAGAELVPGLGEGRLDDLAGEIPVVHDPKDEVVEAAKVLGVEGPERSGTHCGDLLDPVIRSRLVDLSRRQ
jgi:hypothetical protein